MKKKGKENENFLNQRAIPIFFTEHNCPVYNCMTFDNCIVHEIGYNRREYQEQIMGSNACDWCK